MSITNIFKKKPLTKKQQKEREYIKKFKKLEMQLWRNPFKVTEFIEKAQKLMDEAIQDGVMTKEEKEKELIKFNKNINNISEKSEKFKKFIGKA